MTTFQRCALSIVTHAWCRELKKPGDRISRRYVKVESRAYKLLHTFDVNELAMDRVELQESTTKLKYFSSRMEQNNFQFTSEDNPYGTIRIEEVQANYVRGRDGDGNRFEARIYGWNEVQIEDAENSRSSPFLYRLKY